MQDTHENKELANLIQDLTFISQIPPGFKPCFDSRTYVSKDSWTGSLYRWWHKESRTYSLDSIIKILKRIPNHLAQLEPTLLDQVKVGLTNFIQTYGDSFSENLLDLVPTPPIKHSLVDDLVLPFVQEVPVIQEPITIDEIKEIKESEEPIIIVKEVEEEDQHGEIKEPPKKKTMLIHSGPVVKKLPGMIKEKKTHLKNKLAPIITKLQHKLYPSCPRSINSPLRTNSTSRPNKLHTICKIYPIEHQLHRFRPSHPSHPSQKKSKHMVMKRRTKLQRPVGVTISN